MGRRQQGAVGAIVAVAGLAGFGAGERPAGADAIAVVTPIFDASHPSRIPGQRCDACHTFDPGLSHPVDIVPALEVPTQFPLTAGRMTCITCHDDRDDRHGQLRATTPALCAACHTGAGRSAADVHARQLGSAHLSAGRERWGGVLATDALDAETTACLGCHDDLLARGVPHEPIGRRQRARGHDSHPVATPYRRTGAPDPYDGLRHPDLVDPRIRLFDGNLGCGSCHSVYAGEPGLLVMRNERSRLCTSCHDL